MPVSKSGASGGLTANQRAHVIEWLSMATDGSTWRSMLHRMLHGLLSPPGSPWHPVANLGGWSVGPTSGRSRRKPAGTARKGLVSGTPDRIRTCDLRLRRPRDTGQKSLLTRELWTERLGSCIAG